MHRMNPDRSAVGYAFKTDCRILVNPFIYRYNKNGDAKQITEGVVDVELLRKLELKEHFTERECKIADYILRNSEAVLKMTTRELASETFTSATVIVRFVKKIGYEGFQDFKLHLLTDLKESQFERVEVERKEHILSLVNKISSLHEKSLFETKEMLSAETLEKIQEAFQKYNVIDFFGFDANRAIGEYASHNFIQAGVSSNVYASVDKILLYEYYVEHSVVIVISRMGTDEYMCRALHNLRKKDHFIICITGNSQAPITKYADAVLHCSYKENVIQLGDAMFHTSVSYILDLLVSMLLRNNYDRALQLYQRHGELFSK